MSFKTSEPTPPPKGISKTAVVIATFVIIFMLANIFVFPPSDFEKHTQQVDDLDPNIPNGFTLFPGYHTFAKWPFIASVPASHVGSAIDIGWYYDIEYYEYTVIPRGYVGVITNRRGRVSPDPLTPGVYSINLRENKVTIVNTGKRTYYFGDDKSE